MTVGTGTGVSLVFSSGITYTGQALSFKIDGEEIPVIDVSHMGTTGYRKKIFGSLIEPPTLDVEINYEASGPAPVSGTPGTLTITWPDNSTLTGTGAIIKRNSEHKLEEKMVGNYTFQFDGQTGPLYND